MSIVNKCFFNSLNSRVLCSVGKLICVEYKYYTASLYTRLFLQNLGLSVTVLKVLPVTISTAPPGGFFPLIWGTMKIQPLPLSDEFYKILVFMLQNYPITPVDSTIRLYFCDSLYELFSTFSSTGSFVMAL